MSTNQRIAAIEERLEAIPAMNDRIGRIEKSVMETNQQIPWLVESWKSFQSLHSSSAAPVSQTPPIMADSAGDQATTTSNGNLGKTIAALVESWKSFHRQHNACETAPSMAVIQDSDLTAPPTTSQIPPIAIEEGGDCAVASTIGNHAENHLSKSLDEKFSPLPALILNLADSWKVFQLQHDSTTTGAQVSPLTTEADGASNGNPTSICSWPPNSVEEPE